MLNIFRRTLVIFRLFKLFVIGNISVWRRPNSIHFVGRSSSCGNSPSIEQGATWYKLCQRLRIGFSVSLTLPDRTFHMFRASIPVHPQFVCSSKAQISGFWGSVFVKCSFGLSGLFHGNVYPPVCVSQLPRNPTVSFTIFEPPDKVMCEFCEVQNWQILML